jgi:hypothetical protein
MSMTAIQTLSPPESAGASPTELEGKNLPDPPDGFHTPIAVWLCAARSAPPWYLLDEQIFQIN